VSDPLLSDDDDELRRRLLDEWPSPPPTGARCIPSDRCCRDCKRRHTKPNPKDRSRK